MEKTKFPLVSINIQYTYIIRKLKKYIFVRALETD